MSSLPNLAPRKAMGVGRTRILAFFLLALSVAVSSGVLGAKPAYAATFAVNSTADTQDANLANAACDVNASASGSQCTLRAAIQEANDTPGADAIRFNIASSAAVKTISPASALPTIRQALTINGYTQPGASANTRATGNDAILKVQINGTNAGVETNGLKIEADNSTVKGLVINRFKGSGILLDSATGNKVEGNFIGTSAKGNADLGNGGAGVRVASADNTIGGTASGARNVISGNGGDGVEVSGSFEGGTKVLGNYIGTNARGTADLGNDDEGVVISGAPNTTVGGTVAGARNVISGNEDDGVTILSPAGDSKVEGNFIGTTADGSEGLGNTSSGVRIFASNTTIGGTTRAAGNLISDNGEDGVFIFSGVRNRILSNRIFANTGLGIALGTDGVTNNDADDPNTTQPDPDKDGGANNLQNFPVVTSVIQSTSFLNPTKISGTLNSTPNQEFTVQCFTTPSEEADPSGHGEGQGFMAEDTTVTTNPNGNATFECNFLFPQPLEGKAWSATATNEATGDTSEFSANFTVE